MISAIVSFILFFLLSKLILSFFADWRLEQKLLKIAKKFKKSNDLNLIRQPMYDYPMAMIWALTQTCTKQELLSIDLTKLNQKDFKPDAEVFSICIDFFKSKPFSKTQENETMGEILHLMADKKKAPVREPS